MLPDIKFIIQWDIPTNFDAMIQCMRHAGRKGGQTTFIFFTPKWSRLKDLKEIEDCAKKQTGAVNSVKQTALSDANRPKAWSSPLSQIPIAEDFSDTEFLAGSKKDFDEPDANTLIGLLATKAEEKSLKKKHTKKANQSDAEKRAKLPDKIFNYIHVARCRRLFALAWYNDLTYAQNEDGSILTFPTFCCNGPSCQSKEPDFLDREAFINVSIVTYNETN